MRTRILVVLLFSMLFSTAQQKEIDSLEKILENYGQPDTTYVRLQMEYMKKKLFLTPSDSSWLDFANKSLQIAEKLDYPLGQALASEKIGIVYQYIYSDPYKALDYYQKSLEVIEKNNINPNYALGNLGNIGIIYYEQGELRLALTYYKKVLGHVEHNITALANIGEVYADLNMRDSSIYFFKRAIDIAKKDKNFLYEANCLSNMALVLQKEKRNKEALNSIERSLELIDLYQLEFIRSMAYANAGMVYLGIDNLEKAQYYSEKALNSKASLNNLYMHKIIWGTLADVYEKKGDIPKAFEAYKRFTTLNDSISSQDRKVEITRREIQFESDKNQAISQAEIERQKTIRNASILGGGGLVLAILMGLVLYKRRRDALSQKVAAEFNTKVADTELKALRSQMNPHFIFNSLNSINAFITKNDKGTASDYLVKFAKLMRKTLENSEKKEIPLKDDLDLLENYLEIESKRLDKKFTFEIKLDKAIDPENTLVPPLILQPFMENSIWHGIAPKDGTGHIVVDVQKKGNMIVYAIDDDGVGIKKKMDTEKVEAHESLGMKLTRSRIEIINKRKNSNGSVRLIDKKEGVRVEVELPLELAF